MSTAFRTSPRKESAASRTNTKKKDVVKSKVQVQVPEQTACIPPIEDLESPQLPDVPATKEHSMTLTLKGLGKSGKMAFYTGAALTLSIPVNAFVGKTAPTTITDLNVFAEKVAKVDKIKETPAERKVRLASLPKPTLAEKVAKAEERAAKLREKLSKVA